MLFANSSRRKEAWLGPRSLSWRTHRSLGLVVQVDRLPRVACTSRPTLTKGWTPGLTMRVCLGCGAMLGERFDAEGSERSSFVVEGLQTNEPRPFRTPSRRSWGEVTALPSGSAGSTSLT